MSSRYIYNQSRLPCFNHATLSDDVVALRCLIDNHVAAVPLVCAMFRKELDTTIPLLQNVVVPVYLRSYMKYLLEKWRDSCAQGPVVADKPTEAATKVT